MNRKLIFLLLTLLPIRLLAQEFTGRVYDYENKTPLGDVRVINLTTKQSTNSKPAGQFNLTAKKGDVLAFGHEGYHTDTVLLTDVKPLAVFLASTSTNLNQVDIQSARISPYLGIENINAGIKPTKRIEGDGLQGKKNNDRAGGVVLNLGFDKMKAQREKEERLTEADGYENEIRINFNEKTVGNLVKLKGQELRDFITIYQPSVQRVRDEAPFNYTVYIAQAYQAWLKLPPAQRKLQKLK
jgi:hypothetical protein